MKLFWRDRDLLVFVCGMWDVQKFKAGLSKRTFAAREGVRTESTV